MKSQPLISPVPPMPAFAFSPRMIRQKLAESDPIYATISTSYQLENAFIPVSSRNWICNVLIFARISKFGCSCSTTGRPAFFPGLTLSTQLTNDVSSDSVEMRAQKQRTRNRDVALQLLPLRIGKEQNHLFPVVSAQDTEVLTDTFFPAAFRLGLGDPGDEDQLRREDQLLELHAICSAISM